MRSSRNCRLKTHFLVSVLLAAPLIGTAWAQRSRPPPHEHIDRRYSNPHSYYNRGYTINRLPRGTYRRPYGPHRTPFGYDRGNWYRWNGRAWVIWSAPIGALVPWLPPYFATVWWYGIPYYYANDTYYAWDSARGAYAVVAPPPDIDQSATTQAPATNRLFAYPNRGQSEAQQKEDRFECHQWAVKQSDFDPTRPPRSLPPDEFLHKHNAYLRAEATCLQARGYTVR